MSDAPKVEEPVAAPVEAVAPAAAEPAVEAAAEEPAPEAATDAPEAAAAAEEAPAAEAEVKPIEEGVLGYKGPGLLKSLLFQKKFFYFGTEPVESKHLASYLRGEKPEAANKNAAWAAHTGKGLLFFSKKAAEKAHPAGIINLSEISDIKTEGSAIFFFTIAGHKHTFEAASAAERNGWVAALKTKEAEAKELAPTVTESEEYKKAHSALSKPVLATPVAAPKKPAEPKAEDKAEDKAEPKEEKKEETKEDKARKSRSASRKRASIFGAIPGFGKKEEKTEAKEDAAAPAAEASTEAAAAEPAAETAAEPAAEPATDAEPAAAVSTSDYLSPHHD
jgi:hypothetical protein